MVYAVHNLISVLLLGCALLHTGCTSSIDRQTQVEAVAADGETFTVQIINLRAQEVVSQHGEKASFDRGEAVIGDYLVIARLLETSTSQPSSSANTLEVHRTPRAVMAEVDRLPTPYLSMETFELVILDGDQGIQVTDANTGQKVMRAFTCENAACPGEPIGEHPFLFNALGQSAASPVAAPVAQHSSSMAPLPCPACGSPAMVVPYELPDSAVRKQQLLEEVNRTRAARDRRT